MLRFVLKDKLAAFLDGVETGGILSNYNIKTVMLWAVELMSREWWFSFNVVKICNILVGQLVKWLTDKQFPNYFIPEYNLFGHKMYDVRGKEALRILKDLKDESTLGRWLCKTT